MQPKVLLLSALLLAGCAGLHGPRAPVPAPPPAVNSEIVQATLLASYVRDLQTVVQGSATDKAEVVDRARQAYDDARQGPAALRYGLLLAAPEHPQRDPQNALRLLREALARTDLLSPIEQALAMVEKARVEDELGMVTENARLVAEAQQDREERERLRNNNTAILSRRLQTEIDENTRLKKELEDAKSKLEAIANIERNNSVRPPANEARKP